MILVTGAAGKTGRAVIKALAARGAPVRALVRRPEQAPLVESLGANEIVSGDLRDLNAVQQAVTGASAIYYICPNVDPDEVAIGQSLIRETKARGVGHFVYHSVLHPQVEAMPHHWQKLRVEERLFESGLPVTILQPTAYMQNLLANWDNILNEGKYSVPYPVETRMALVDLGDVAEAAAIVLTEPGHTGATYELVGAASLSQVEVAAQLSRGLNRPIIAESTPIEAWENKARASGLGEYQIDTLCKMFRYYDYHSFTGNPNVLGWLLGRPPTTLESFIERIVKESN